jgi:hypothetical protein
MRTSDKNALVARLASLSDADAANGPPYFQNMVRAAGFPDAIKNKGTAGYIGDASFNARRLVDFALNVGTNPQDGNAALGSVLYPLLPGLGVEDATLVAGTIVTYRLLRSQAELDDLRTRYQIPERLLDTADKTAAQIETGPPVAWAAETRNLELQGWFAPEPQLLEFETVLTAAKRARAVCRVEVAAGGMGTGVLIRPDLVLTNFHVMSRKDMTAAPAALEANARNTVLRFAAFTAKGPAAKGQEVRLGQPAVVASSVKYDFALLRTDGSFAADVEPFSELGVMPVKTNPLYVIQHPEGGPMKLALSSKGVTWIDPDLVTIEYTTNVAGGSSGSPCFDADWKLVALHHAGQGSKGQGILMQSIFKQIEPHLHA